MTRALIRKIVMRAFREEAPGLIRSAAVVLPCVRYIWHDHRADVLERRGRGRSFRARIHRWLARRAYARAERTPRCLPALEAAFSDYVEQGGI